MNTRATDGLGNTWKVMVVLETSMSIVADERLECSQSLERLWCQHSLANLTKRLFHTMHSKTIQSPLSVITVDSNAMSDCDWS